MRNSYQLEALFEKLCNFLGIIDKWCWDGDLRSPMGTHRFCWMPQLCSGYRRLTYEEFLVIYSTSRSFPDEGMPERKKWQYRTNEEQKELDERTESAFAYLITGV